MSTNDIIVKSKLIRAKEVKMKKIMICVDIEKDSLESIEKGCEKLEFDAGDHVYLVHGFQIRTYTDLFYVTTMPGKDQYDIIKESVVGILDGIKKTILSKNKEVKVTEECLFSSLIKREILEYAQGEDMNKIIIFTRDKHGFFDSSFAQYMLKNSKFDLEIIRS